MIASWRSRVISHPLDHLEDFTNDWIAHLQESDPISPDYNGPRCPFAKKARDENRLGFRKVYDYFSAYDFWEVVSEECDKFDGSKDVVIVAAHSNANHITADSIGGGVDALNTFLNCQGKDLWLLTKVDQLFTIVMVQKISSLDDSAKLLANKGYYTTRYSEQQMEKVVTGRRKYREKLTKKIERTRL